MPNSRIHLDHPAEMDLGEALTTAALEQTYTLGWNAGYKQSSRDTPTAKTLLIITAILAGIMVGGTGAFFMGLWGVCI